MTTLPSSFPTTRRGFTLTELAIVLGIMGAILGAIWVASARVYANNRVSTGVREVLAVVQGVRAVYATKGYIDAGNLTQAMINLGVYPANMIQACTGSVSSNYDGISPCALDPWGVEMQVGSQTGWAGAPGGNNKAFEVIDWNPIKDCGAFMAGVVTGAASAGGLLWVYANNGWAGTVTGATSVSTEAACNGYVAFQFSL
jgi:prepilin-type N-terminal cleavage/methylation domain-containing protein